MYFSPKRSRDRLPQCLSVELGARCVEATDCLRQLGFTLLRAEPWLPIFHGPMPSISNLVSQSVVTFPVHRESVRRVIHGGAAGALRTHWR